MGDISEHSKTESVHGNGGGSYSLWDDIGNVGAESEIWFESDHAKSDAADGGNRGNCWRFYNSKHFRCRTVPDRELSEQHEKDAAADERSSGSCLLLWSKGDARYNKGTRQ